MIIFEVIFEGIFGVKVNYGVKIMCSRGAIFETELFEIIGEISVFENCE